MSGSTRCTCIWSADVRERLVVDDECKAHHREDLTPVLP